MKQEKKFLWQLFFQAAAATAAVIIFFGLLFVVMNRSQQAIVGVGIQIYPHANGVVVDLYGNGYLPVSYTHLDVYKRQVFIVATVKGIMK